MDRWISSSSVAQGALCDEAVLKSQQALSDARLTRFHYVRGRILKPRTRSRRRIFLYQPLTETDAAWAVNRLQNVQELRQACTWRNRPRWGGLVVPATVEAALADDPEHKIKGTTLNYTSGLYFTTLAVASDALREYTNDVEVTEGTFLVLDRVAVVSVGRVSDSKDAAAAEHELDPKPSSDVAVRDDPFAVSLAPKVEELFAILGLGHLTAVLADR
ncbi:hypothetical protein LY78DRAFT_31257 [Colletotrichum sublineola]|nr:hypothetical protein LY78DRAFT_31257 [Colletotrichum sublineola]